MKTKPNKSLEPASWLISNVRQKMSERLDTRLESEGAEFLVLGHLLLHKIPAYKTYTNMPGYDLVATNPEKRSSARIQVKSRWRTGATGFPISNFECEFVVAAFLNRGSKDGRKKISEPVYYIFPVDIIAALPSEGMFNNRDIRSIKNLEHYRANWSLISEFLKKKKDT